MPMLDSNTTRRQIPFYGSYAVFYKAMRVLKNAGLPRRVETRVFAGKLEAEASRIVAGFSALEWIDEAGRPTEDLRKLVEAFGTETWGPTVAEILPKSYPFLNKLDLESATNNDMREAFVAYIGRDAETLRNAETFFLCLATEAGRSMSEVFSRRAARGVGDARRWLKLAEIEGVFEEQALRTADVNEPPKTKTNHSEEGDSLASVVVKLISLLMNKSDRTDDDKALGDALISYLGRQLQRD